MAKAWLHGLKGGTRYAIFLRTVTIPKAAGRHDSDLLYFRTDTKGKMHVANATKYEALFSRKNRTLI